MAAVAIRHALDTEFMRVDTFYPIAGLIQIGDGVRAYLIDPLTIDNWQPLAALLENPAVIKVVHACSEDLEVLLAPDRQPASAVVRHPNWPRLT